jgi:predicted dehydrogenase
VGVCSLIERALLVGLGSIGRRHLRLARDLMPRADIRVLRHQVSSETSEYANDCFYSIETAVNFAPQIAIIANPATYHVAVAQILADAGVHLLIEKPLSKSLDGISKLIETCQRKSLVISTGYNLRFYSSLQYYKKILDEGIVGKVLSVRCEVGEYLPSWRPVDDYRNGVSARYELGGGALLELSHEIDYLRWIFGEVEWVKSTLGRQSSLEINVEDTVHLTLGFVAGHDGHQLIGTLNLDFIRQDKTRSCLAIGERGSLRWNGLSGGVELYEKSSARWLVLFSHQEKIDDSYKKELNNFLEAIAENKAPIVTGKDGLRVMEIIEAARMSNINAGARFDLANIKEVKGGV